MVAGFFLLSGILTATWNARIPDVQQGLGLNDAAWGTVLVALPAGLVTGLFLSSWLVAHFGTLRVTLVTSLLACLLLLLLGRRVCRVQEDHAHPSGPRLAETFIQVPRRGSLGWRRRHRGLFRAGFGIER